MHVFFTFLLKWQASQFATAYWTLHLMHDIIQQGVSPLKKIVNTIHDLMDMKLIAANEGK